MTNIVLNSRKMIESYLSGEIGFEFLSKKHSAPYTSLRTWVHGYEKMEKMRCFTLVKIKNILLNINFLL